VKKVGNIFLSWMFMKNTSNLIEARHVLFVLNAGRNLDVNMNFNNTAGRILAKNHINVDFVDGHSHRKIA
jgi:hypothetical protein